MASFNQVILLGNLTRDPQLRFLPSQMAVCEFGMAMNHKFRTKDGQDREEVTFIDCTAWGRQAEVINQYMTKGKPLFVQGRLKLDQWEDKQGGGKRSKLTVVVENFQFVGGREGGQGGGGNYEGGQGNARPASRGPQRDNQAPPEEAPPISEQSQVPPDDIPF